MGSRYDYESKFDKAQQRAQRRNDEIVRKFRHKPQNLFKAGQMFRVNLKGWLVRRRNGTFSRFWGETGTHMVVALQDSDHFLTKTDPEDYWGKGLGLTVPFHMWPFLKGVDVVWYVIDKSDEPMANLRARFLREFKLVK